jgi:hypothetical protein
MIEGKGQQILNKIQLSPTKTISTRMQKICMFFTWCFHKQNYYIICMFINLTNTLSG